MRFVWIAKVPFLVLREKGCVSVAKRRKAEAEGQMIAWNKCPGCGATISSGAAYCPNCGEPWTVKCSRCGASWRFWKFYKFCPDCGVAVEKFGNIPGKQRQAAQEGGKR